MLLAEEIAEEYPVQGKSVLTPSGMQRVKTVYRTVPLPVWVLCTTGHTLRCSGHHLVKLLGYCERVQNLYPGEWVDTEAGYEKVISVSPTGEVEEMYDVTVDTDSGIFYSSGICSHNSTTFAARQLINGSLFPGYKSMYVVPFPDHMKTYARRFQEMEQAFRGNMGKQNVYNKVYSNGSAIDLIYCLTTADKSRGKTEDEVLLDECCVGSTELYPLHGNPVTIDCCQEGTIIRSFDEHKKVVYDKIVRKKNNGIRHCWTVKTASGRTIACTANHRFRSPGGWFYLADIISDSAASIDPTVALVRGRSSIYDDKQAHARIYAGNTSGRRLHIQTGTTLVHAPIHRESWNRAGRIRYDERVNVTAANKQVWPYRKPRIRSGIIQSANSYSPGISLLSSSLLRKLRYAERYTCAAQIRVSSLGRPVNLGSYCLVGTGRRKLVQQLLHNKHPFILKGRSGQTCSMVSQSRHERRKGYEGKQAGQVLLRYQHGCPVHVQSSFNDSSVRSSKYALQNRRSRAAAHRDMFNMRMQVRDEQATIRYAEKKRQVCVPERRLPEMAQKAGKSKVQRQDKATDYLIEPTSVVVDSKGSVTTTDTIVSITYAGMEEVWDIQTERFHTFFANGFAVHNCQNMDPDIIPELLYVQTMSKTPSTIYAGTALSVDTLLEEKWSESSQGMWHVRAGDGAHWLNMYDRDTLLKVCDNPQGPTCPYTGKKLNVTDGCYIHGNQQALAAGDIGIHVPQCIIPDIAYDPVQWGKVYRRIKRDDFKKVLQECFGIAVAEGSREISENDLIRLCVLTDTKEQLMAKCRSGYYRLIVSGCDWGGSDYNQAIKSKTSYTVHCIIGVAPDGGIDILHWRRHSGMNYPEIAQIIINEHNAWGAQAIASDFGVGMAYNMELRNSIPFDKHFIMGYVGPMSAPLAEPKGQHMPNQLSLNRTEALTNVFKDIKNPVLKIRCRNWDDMAPFLTDFLNMYRLPIEMPGGANTFKYVRSSTKADDALHAFTFAYVLAKFYLGEPLVRDEALERRLRDVLYSPAAANSELAHSVLGVPNYVVSG